MRIAILVTAVLAAAAPATPASAESARPAEPIEPVPPAPGLAHQVQLDFGLAVVGLGYEVPVAARLALMLEAQIFGTYFLPWFDAGDAGRGLGAELRATWFARPTGRGLYVLAYARADAMRITRDDLTADGLGVSGGGAVGWAFGLTRRLDLRLGLGVQYIYTRAEAQGAELGARTPFPTIDGVLGYRL
jgi:hypothetical protein